MARPLVVVGASLAGLRAVEGARQRGHGGPLVLVGAEPHLPYDRPPLSKAFLAPGEHLPPPTHRTADELAALGVELRLGAPATALDPEAGEVVLGDERLPYAAVVVATGARARTLPGPVPEGVHVLRTLEDARAVRSALDDGARTVVVGAGLVGSEVAAAARARDLPVTVVEAGPAPLLRAVGRPAAGLYAALHARAGSELRCDTAVEGLEQEGGRVTGVRLADGSRLPADLVVVGVGADPETGWLAGSGVAVDDGVLVDATLAASVPGVWAAGDVARVDVPGQGRLRLEHWAGAAEQGRLAGANAAAVLAGQEPVAYAQVPSFWSEAFGSTLQGVGLPGPDDEAEVLGGPDGPWLVLYRRGDRLSAAVTLDLPGRIMKFRRLLSQGAPFADALELARSRPLVPAA